MARKKKEQPFVWAADTNRVTPLGFDPETGEYSHCYLFTHLGKTKHVKIGSPEYLETIKEMQNAMGESLDRELAAKGLPNG